MSLCYIFSSVVYSDIHDPGVMFRSGLVENKEISTFVITITDSVNEMKNFICYNPRTHSMSHVEGTWEFWSSAIKLILRITVGVS